MHRALDDSELSAGRTTPQVGSATSMQFHRSSFLSGTLTETGVYYRQHLFSSPSKLAVSLISTAHGSPKINLISEAGVDVTFLRIVLIALVALSVGNAIIVFALL